ncbi:response regulator [Amycolatopsis azurea]|uniref:response regulator transcription factor n=1 Tax=Amycolatopsis azurea TaxID=36819 RepID=UPI00382533DA
MAMIRKPVVPAGPHRLLVDALHEAYLRAGAPSLRAIAERGGLSRDTAHRVLTHDSLPTWGALNAVVLGLGDEPDRFRDLWINAARPDDAPPTTGDGEPSVVSDGGEVLRLVLLEDHPLYRTALERVLSHAGHHIVGAVDNGEQAIALALETRPDLVLADYVLQGLTGADVVARIRAMDPEIRVLVLSGHGTPEVALRSLAAGASGFLSKDADVEELLAALRSVTRGEIVLPDHWAHLPAFAEVSAQSTPARVVFTPSEMKVLTLIAKGMTDAEISASTNLTIRTVRYYIDRVRDKTGIRKRAGLVAYAFQEKLSRPGAKD